MGRKSKITLDKHDRADQRQRTEKLIEQTKDVSDLNPEPPMYFSETAGSMWRIVVPVLKKMQTVKETDHAIVEAFCITYEQLITAYKDVQEHGQVQAIWKTVILPTGDVLRDGKGEPRRDFQGYKRNPSTQILDAATMKLKQLADKTDDVDIGEAMQQFFG